MDLMESMKVESLEEGGGGGGGGGGEGRHLFVLMIFLDIHGYIFSKKNRTLLMHLKLYS